MKKAILKNNQTGALPILASVLILVVLSIIAVTSSSWIKDNFFATLFPKAASNPETQTMKVLVLAYYPLDSNDTDLNPLATGVSTPLVDMKNHVKNITDQAVLQLTNGTKFRGYKNASATAAINYQVVNNKEYREALPISNNPVPWNTSVFRPDYQHILTRENICDYVDNQNVQQVWLWGYHYGKIEPVESNMAMGTNVQSFWNKSGYGDVSNSEQTNDMPICRNTYTLYNYNYTRGLGEVLEDHGHQIEAVMRFVDAPMWDKFQKPNGALNNTTNRCGWTHSPPNSGDWSGDRGQYDWNDKTIVKSDCEDWKPDGGGIVKDVNCNTWYEPFYAKSYATEPCQDDMGVAFKVWWMQNIPGLNNGLTAQNYKLRNWWDFYSNFDRALLVKKSLVSDEPLPTPTPIPKIQLITPNGSETFIPGEKVTIKWEGDTTRTAYQLSYKTSTGVSGSITHISDPATKSFEWTVPNIQNMRVGDSRQAKIEIYSYPASGGNIDMSDNFFTVTNVDPNADADTDGFTNAKELWLGTKYNKKCADNATDHAWPADVNNNTYINGGDVSTLVPYITKEKPYNKRYDLNQDGQITVTDVDVIVPFFLQTCTDPNAGVPDPNQKLSPELQSMLKSIQPVETPKPTPTPTPTPTPVLTSGISISPTSIELKVNRSTSKPDRTYAFYYAIPAVTVKSIDATRISVDTNIWKQGFGFLQPNVNVSPGSNTQFSLFIPATKANGTYKTQAVFRGYNRNQQVGNPITVNITLIVEGMPPQLSKPVVQGLPSCANTSYTATVNWQATDVVYYTDLSTSSNFISYWNKYTFGTTSTKVPDNFEKYLRVSSKASLQPNTTYYLRNYSYISGHSPITTIYVPRCKR